MEPVLHVLCSNVSLLVNVSQGLANTGSIIIDKFIISTLYVMQSSQSRQEESNLLIQPDHRQVIYHKQATIPKELFQMFKCHLLLVKVLLVESYSGCPTIVTRM